MSSKRNNCPGAFRTDYLPDGFTKDEQHHKHRSKILDKRVSPEETDSPALDFDPEHVPRPEVNQRYPPIITIDGRVDTDIDHLMDDSEEELRAIEASQRKYPKPHVFSVINGSIDDDVDSLANHDGTMEHTLVDAPKTFNPRDLKDVSAKGERKRSPERATRAAIIDRSYNKKDPYVSDDEDDFSQAQDRPMKQQDDPKTCIEPGLSSDEYKNCSDRSGADEFGSASKESIRLNTKLFPAKPMIESGNEQGRQISSKKQNRISYKQQTQVSDNEEKKIEAGTILDDHLRQPDSDSIGVPYTRNSGFSKTYDHFFVDDTTRTMDDMPTMSVERCKGQNKDITTRKLNSTGEKREQNIKARSYAASDGELLDEERSELTHTGYVSKSSEQIRKVRKNEYKSEFMQNEVRRGIQCNNFCNKNKTCGGNKTNDSAVNSLNKESISNDSKISQTVIDEGPMLSSEKENKTLKKAEDWLERVKSFISEENLEKEAGGNTITYSDRSLAEGFLSDERDDCDNTGPISSEETRDYNSRSNNFCTRSVTDNGKQVKNGDRLLSPGRPAGCQCRPEKQELCFVCRTKEKSKKMISLRKKQHYAQKKAADIENLSSPSPNSSLVYYNDFETSRVFNNTANKNFTSNKSIVYTDMMKDLDIITFNSDDLGKPLAQHVEEFTRDPRSSKIHGSLKAAIRVAEQSMSAAAKVAQALSLVIEATQATRSLSHTSSSSLKSRSKTRPRSLSSVSSVHSVQTLQQTLSDHNISNESDFGLHVENTRVKDSSEDNRGKCRTKLRRRSGSRERKHRSSTCDKHREYPHEAHNRSPRTRRKSQKNADDNLLKHRRQQDINGRIARVENDRKASKYGQKSSQAQEKNMARDKNEDYFENCTHKQNLQVKMSRDAKRHIESSREKHNSSRPSTAVTSELKNMQESEGLCQDDKFWSVPYKDENLSPTHNYTSHVVKCWQNSIERNCLRSPNDKYLRSRLVGSSVDPDSRDNEYDSFEFNANAKVSDYIRQQDIYSKVPAHQENCCIIDQVWGKCSKDRLNNDLWQTRQTWLNQWEWNKPYFNEMDIHDRPVDIICCCGKSPPVLKRVAFGKVYNIDDASSTCTTDFDCTLTNPCLSSRTSTSSYSFSTGYHKDPTVAPSNNKEQVSTSYNIQNSQCTDSICSVSTLNEKCSLSEAICSSQSRGTET